MFSRLMPLVIACLLTAGSLVAQHLTVSASDAWNSGGVVLLRLSLTNEGKQSLTDVSLLEVRLVRSDGWLRSETNSIPSLAPGESATFLAAFAAGPLTAGGVSPVQITYTHARAPVAAVRYLANAPVTIPPALDGGLPTDNPVLTFVAAQVAAGTPMLVAGPRTIAPDGNPVEVPLLSAEAMQPTARGGLLPAGTPAWTLEDMARLQWTNALRWGRVFNLLAFGGNPNGADTGLPADSVANDEALALAQFAAVAAGGGTIYFPAGTYFFANSILLQPGVVLRGESPIGVTSALDPAYAPSSRLEFPRYVFDVDGDGLGDNTPNDTAFKGIRLADPLAHDVGLVHLAINRATVSLGDNGQTGTAWAAGARRVVFGSTVRNAMTPEAAVPASSTAGGVTRTQEPWHRFTNRFTAAISVATDDGAAVVNNRLLPATDNFIVRGARSEANAGAVTGDSDPHGYLLTRSNQFIFAPVGGSNWVAPIVFDYDNRYGIVVNRPGTAGRFGSEAVEDPGLYRPGILIADNYAYSTGRVPLHASGSGLIIRNNEIRNQTVLHGGAGRVPRPTQTGRGNVVTGSATNENRGIDFGGADVLVEGNLVESYTGNLGQSVSGDYNDGEGILVQQSSGTNAYRHRVRYNIVHGNNPYLGLYNLGYIVDSEVVGNDTGSGIQVFRDSAGVRVGSPFPAGMLSGNLIADNIVRNGQSGSVRNVALRLNGGVVAPLVNNAIVDNVSTSPRATAVSVSGPILWALDGNPYATAIEGNEGFYPVSVASAQLERTVLNSTTVRLRFPDASVQGVPATSYLVQRRNGGNWTSNPPFDVATPAPVPGGYVEFDLTVPAITSGTGPVHRIQSVNAAGASISADLTIAAAGYTLAVAPAALGPYTRPASGSTVNNAAAIATMVNQVPGSGGYAPGLSVTWLSGPTSNRPSVAFSGSGNFTTAAGSTITRNVNVTVAANTSPGTYTFELRASAFGNTIIVPAGPITLVVE